MPSLRPPAFALSVMSFAASAPLLASAALPQERDGQRGSEGPAYTAAVEEVGAQAASDRFAAFTPTEDPIRHRIDFDIWDYALKNIVLSMGPSTRTMPLGRVQEFGTRIRQGHNSRYRLEGSLVTFLFMERDVIASFTDYRKDLEEVAGTLDIASLPRNEQLAFWFNLHNVALLEQIANVWPVRQPRELELDGVPLDDAKILTVRGVAMSLRDIRENIVYANWKNPKVIYGFWRGEIGGPALQRTAFTGANVSSLLDVAAEDYINSLRGTQKRGSTLQVSTLYEETGEFYFPDFERDVRAHIAEYANEDVAQILARTETIDPVVREWDIADLSGGARPANYLTISGPGSARVPYHLALFIRQRNEKLRNMQRREIPTGRVIFSNIDLPGDPPNKNAVE